MYPHVCMCVRTLGAYSGLAREEELVDACYLFSFSHVHFTVYIYLLPTRKDELLDPPSSAHPPSRSPHFHPPTHPPTHHPLPLPLPNAHPPLARPALSPACSSLPRLPTRRHVEREQGGGGGGGGFGGRTALCVADHASV